MALARILVDGYSLLHGWPELAPGKARHSAAAREELVHWLTQYRDAAGTPITIIFDGANASPGMPKIPSPPDLEVLYSKEDQTADQMIERATHRLLDYGDVLVVTDDYAERDTVTALGACSASCANFVQMVESALADLQTTVKHHNRRERNQFNRSR
jgi:uncharacterized protein